MTQSITAETRKNGTKGELNKLRREGKIPGVVYGREISPSPVAVEEKDLLALLRTHPNAVLELNTSAGNKQNVMITDVQRDGLTRKVLHIDFMKINMNEKIKTEVRIELTGDSTGVREGGILQTISHEIEVECLPTNIPDSIEVDISGLGVGENLLVKDISAPQGVEIKSDLDMVIVTILAPQKELSEEEAADAAVELKEAETRSEAAQKHAVDMA